MVRLVTFEVYLAYIMACTVLLFIPGPTILLVVSYAMTHGRKSAFATIFGVMVGDTVAMALSFLGLGALLMTSARLFLLMKVLGAAYLVYLGVKMWRAPTIFENTSLDGKPVSNRAMALDAFTVTVLNPKSGMFFIAFLPQFMDASRPLLPQTLVLGGTFLGLAFTSVTLYAVLASEIRRVVRNPAVSKAVNRAGAGALIGAGVLTAALKRA
jgi:threonine/homoserine/homoserine lactone efflux protein